jgi:hypothetical protein
MKNLIIENQLSCKYKVWGVVGKRAGEGDETGRNVSRERQASAGAI